MRILKKAALALVLPILLAGTAAAQGVQTGELRGTVSSSDGLTLPGATVTVQGPTLQGVRTVVSDENGNYVIPALPPGRAIPPRARVTAYHAEERHGLVWVSLEEPVAGA